MSIWTPSSPPSSNATIRNGVDFRWSSVPSANDAEIFRTAWALFEAESRNGRPVRLIGLGISGWGTDLGLQQDLFDTDAPLPTREDDRLDQTLDAIRDKFGRGCIQRGLSSR